MSGAGKQVICIQCPVGCELTVLPTDAEPVVQGAYGEDCKPGREYAIAEVTAPLRVVTTTVRVDGGQFPLVSVRTDAPIPRERILDCLRQLRALTVSAPVQGGQTVLECVAGTTSNIVATRTVARADPAAGVPE